MRRPGLAKAIAPIAANLSVDLHAACAPRNPTPVVMFNGTDDPLMLYEGGTPTIVKSNGSGVISAEDTARLWARQSSYGLRPRTTHLPDRVDDGTTVSILTYPCPDQEVLLYRVNGGGHGVPGSTHPSGIFASAERVCPLGPTSPSCGIPLVQSER